MLKNQKLVHEKFPYPTKSNIKASYQATLAAKKKKRMKEHQQKQFVGHLFLLATVAAASITNNNEHHHRLLRSPAANIISGNKDVYTKRRKLIFGGSDFDFDFPSFGGNDGNDGRFFDNIDWDNMDWSQLNFLDDLNLDDLDWSTFFGFLGVDNETSPILENFEICPMIESLVGIGQAFGIAGDCTCEGSIADGMSVECQFDDQCIQPMVCGSVSFNVTLGQNVGGMVTDVCVDLAGESTLPEICYGYELSMLPDSNYEQSCTASYGGPNNQCICEMTDGCFYINCEQYLPGAVMDTCQTAPQLPQQPIGTTASSSRLQTADDAKELFPQFKMFEPDFELNFDFIDWNSMDWENVDWSNFDFGDLVWNTTSGDFWDGINMDDIKWGDMFGGFDFDITAICPALEQFAGIGQSFGVAGGCTCNGDLAEGLGIDCNFENECVSDNYNSSMLPYCGSVDMDVSFGQVPNTYSTNVCAQLSSTDGDDSYPEICYSYTMSMVDSSISLSCVATYGDTECSSCTIENFCMSMDCNNVLPGAAMDSCQHLDDVFMVDTSSDNNKAVGAGLMPRLQIFEPDFELDFGEIDWMSVDWENMDWPNFDMDSLWNHSNWDSTEWRDIFDINVDATMICPVLENLAGMGEEFGIAGGCACAGDSTSGLDLDCSFEEVCTDNNDDSLCGSTDITFEFDDLGSIAGEACVDFAGDDHPNTCFSYNIPLADPNTLPECAATYGEAACGCTIDENFCVSIDCSAYDSAAVTDTCQTLSWDTSDDVITFIPRFAQKSSVTDGGADDDVDETKPTEQEGVQDNVSNAVTDNSSVGGSLFRSLFVTTLGIWSALLLL